jgi:hypothetical protein
MATYYISECGGERMDNRETFEGPKITVAELSNWVHRLWDEHVLWTRLTIISIANNLPDTELVINRLLNNATQFGFLFANFFSQEIARRFALLMREHLVIAVELVRAAKRGDTEEVARLEKEWYRNADEIARFLSEINPHWSEEEIKRMMHEHLALTENEAVAILNNRWEESIDLFSKIEHQAYMMANTYIEGLVAQFPDRFIRE